MHLARMFELAVFGVVIQSLENDGLNRIVFVRHGLVRVHAFYKIDSLFERFLYFFMIESVGRRILQPFAIDE